MLVVMLCYTMSSVALVIFMLVLMPCSVGDYVIVDVVDSYVASRAYAHALSLHHVNLSWLSILHSSLTRFN